jgi:hypothetical protein
MHRSGTSAFARGLQALGVYIGDDFLAPQPDNPTGFWEDRHVYELNEHLLRALGTSWFSPAPIDRFRFDDPQVRVLRNEARDYLADSFTRHPVWGFKDPRAIRLLPFWRPILHELRAEDTYVIAVRHPMSVAASLQHRQWMDAETAHLLWLSHLVPYAHQIADRPFVVVDYDLFVADPRAQLARIVAKLQLTPPDAGEIERFLADFLDENLRHSVYSRYDCAGDRAAMRLSAEAYLWLYELASDRIDPDRSAFWPVWANLATELDRLLRARERAAAAACA